jgi:predicted DCC family thiol-disulfide oxidoreductase YuxK
MNNSVGKSIVFFDGTCVLCHGFFRWLIKNDRNKLFSFATLQSPPGVEMIKHLKVKVNEETIILLHQGTAFTFSSAVLKIFILLGGFNKIVGRLGFIFPKILRDGVYLFISRYRYKIFGKQACMIPDSETRDRFISHL